MNKATVCITNPNPKYIKLTLSLKFEVLYLKNIFQLNSGLSVRFSIACAPALSNNLKVKPGTRGVISLYSNMNYM
jgi:hypothetical protein